jgi:phosphoribosylformimino-5-aminoimidazole carboxamide ribonucleotide (ProFAR) isomerase
MNKPYFNNIEIEKGDMLEHHIHKVGEDGVVVGINYEQEEIYMYEDGEGWTVSKEFDNMGDIEWK